MGVTYKIKSKNGTTINRNLVQGVDKLLSCRRLRRKELAELFHAALTELSFTGGRSMESHLCKLGLLLLNLEESSLDTVLDNKFNGRDWFGLPKSMDPIHSLILNRRIPVRIHEIDS